LCPLQATDLGAAHNASSGWLDGEANKVTQWGHGEIQRILAQTKGMEEQLVAGAKEKQKALDAKHSGELAKLVQQLDLKKAAELKELEDGLQRQIQAALTTSKNEINRIESEMNKRKMDLLQQSQLRSAKEIDSLSNLVVETKLVPSQTKTVIETATNTANVIAVATGGSISTGSAAAQTHDSAKIAAIPNAGQLSQAAEVTTGDMIQDATGRKVGEGAIVNTMTNVTEQPKQNVGPRDGQDVNVQARPLQSDQSAASTSRPVVPARPTAPTATTSSTSEPSGLLTQEQLKERERRLSADHGVVSDKDQRHGATQRPGQSMPIDHGREAGSKPMVAPVGQSTGVTSSKVGEPQLVQQHDTKAAVDPALSKQSAAASSTYGAGGDKRLERDQHITDASGTTHHQQQPGLMGKVKHALGMEPKSSDATRRGV
jgi:hypothetical protein